MNHSRVGKVVACENGSLCLLHSGKAVCEMRGHSQTIKLHPVSPNAGPLQVPVVVLSWKACAPLPGPKGPSKEVVAAVVEMKRRNPQHYRPESDGDGISWLTAIGHAKDSLWSVDYFRCESILLRSYWVMVVIDVFTRRLIGFGIERGDLDRTAVCVANC